jgi:phytoene dehydrogenase-like protein
MFARDGLKVLCLEKTNWAGGMAATKAMPFT